MNFDAQMKKYHEKCNAARAMGGKAKLEAIKNRGELNARERIDYMLDHESFQEVGLFVHSDQPGMEERSPCDGKIVGFGKIDGRPVSVVSLDLTVLGASSANSNAKKMAYIKRMSCSRGLPVVFLSEAGGARMPDYMGARGMVAMAQDPSQYQRLRESPWVSYQSSPPIQAQPAMGLTPTSSPSVVASEPQPVSRMIFITVSMLIDVLLKGFKKGRIENEGWGVKRKIAVTPF